MNTHRDPTTLRPHPLVKNMRRWGKESAEWAAFVEDIRANGIRNPLKITADGMVVDGETRRQAALDLQIAEVPVVEVGQEEALETVLRELVLRRNLTKGQLAYTAYPIMAPAHEEAVARKGENLRKGQCFSVSYSVGNRGEKGTIDLACKLGISRQLFDQAAKLHRLFEARPDLREKFEPSIYDADRPAGLGGVLAGIGYLVDTEKWPHKRRGGPPKEQARKQMLWDRAVRDEVNRWEYWVEMGDDARAEHWRRLRKLAAGQARERCGAMAEYHGRLARELEQFAKGEGHL